MDRIRSIWKSSAAPPAGIAPANAHAAAEIVKPDTGEHEQRLISNIRTFRDLTVGDIMLPRAEILAVEVDTDLPALLELVAANTHSRIPVYRGTLDDVVGVFHIKDLISAIVNKTLFSLEKIVRPVPIVAPSMRAVDLLLEMRRNRTHIALVIDEFGGIDGLVTIEDLIEEIIGEIEDEHDRDSFGEIVEDADGSLLVDARMPIEDFEQRFGQILAEPEREAFDTVGGLIWSLAGHIPAKGELIHHSSGAQFEVVDVDERRIKHVRARRVAMPLLSELGETG